MNIDRDIIRREYRAKDFEELLEDLVQEIKLRNYRITRINNIDNIHDREQLLGRIKAGFRYYKIVEFCNLNSCSELISSDLLAGVFMPVRFVVYQHPDENHTHVAFLRPTAFARLFDSESLTRVALELEKDMNDVLEEIDF